MISNSEAETIINNYNQSNKRKQLKIEDVEILQDFSLRETGRRLTMLEALLILGSIAVGIGQS